MQSEANMKSSNLPLQIRIAGCVLGSALIAFSAYKIREAYAASTTLAISQVPLTITTVTRPQVMLAITNSESMDGGTLTYCNGTSDPSAACTNNFSSSYTTRGGGLMTGAGAVSALSGSSSPINYPVPVGFTPPVTGGAAGSSQPYTSSLSNGQLADNSPSRLNVAKAGILSILNSYLATTDFGLMSYNVSGTSLYSTWVYYMAPANGFSFTNTTSSSTFSASTSAPMDTVFNPCYNATNGSTVYSNCSSIASKLGVSTSTITTNQYMTVSNTSDDAVINDVLYTSGLNPIVMQYGTPIGKNNFGSLANYKTGNVSVTYPSTAPSSNLSTITPTNAGFVPSLIVSAPQVMYAQRGWGYGGSQSYSSGKINVSMTNLGSGPSNSAVTTAYNSFSPYLQPETNSSSSSEIKAAAGQSPIYALLNSASSAFPVSSGSCAPQKYVVLVTDGLPTQDKSGYFWPPVGTQSAKSFGATAAFNSDGSLNTTGTNDQALIDTITQIQTLASNGIKTYVIGLGAGVTPTQNPTAAQSLTAMAVAGGTSNYYPAVNAQAFSSALSTILVQIQKGSYDQASASLNSTTLNANSVAYFASYNPSTSPNSDWTGNLAAYSLGNGTSLSASGTATWQAQTQIDSFARNNGWSSSRLVATWDPLATKGVPFEWPTTTKPNGINSTQQSQLQPSSDGKGNLRLNYLRGDQSQEIQNGGGFRNRSHLLGDIVNSGPAYVGKANGPYFDSSYQSFVTTTASRPSRIYVGGNDGMLHAIDTSTGNEAFAFIPNGVFANLYQLPGTSYNSAHRYFVDGSPVAGDAQFSDGSWHTILTGGLNSGGKSIYALDVTTPQNITDESKLSSAILWEFTETDMGLSYSRPTIAKVNLSNKFAVFFGNGYNSPSNKAILYAVDPQSGSQLAKIDLCAAVSGACSSSLPEGLSSVTAINSSGNAGSAIDRIYAGDLQGNLWSINVSSSNSSSWTVTLLFTAKDSSGNIQPITSTPTVSLAPSYPARNGVMVYFGTGELLTQADVTNTNTQAFYGVWDSFSNNSLTPSNLLQMSKTVVSSTTSGLTRNTVTSSINDWTNPTGCSGTCPTYSGWYFNLSFAGSGARAITDPLIYGGNVVFTTYTPSTTQCTSGGTSYLMGVNYATGGAPTNPFFDVNGDGLVNSADTYNNSPLTGIALGTYYTSAPNLILSGNTSLNGYILAGGAGAGASTQCNNSYLAACTGVKIGTSFLWKSWWQLK